MYQGLLLHWNLNCVSQHSLLLLTLVTPTVRYPWERHKIPQEISSYAPRTRSDLCPERQGFIPSAWKKSKGRANPPFATPGTCPELPTLRFEGFCCLMILHLDGKGEGRLCCHRTLPWSHFLSAVFAAGSFCSNLNIKYSSSLFPGEGQLQGQMETLN